MTMMKKHHRAALIGFLCATLFFLLNFIVSLRIEPFYFWLESFPSIRQSSITPLALLLLFPIGAIIALYPMLQKGSDGKRRMYILNSIVAAILLLVFFFLFIPLAKDFYTCDILKIPNCD